MTKAQLKSKVKRLFTEINPILDKLEDLINNVDEAIEEIEPYEGHDDLTEAQQERLNLFDEFKSTLDELKDAIEYQRSDLDEKLELDISE